MAIRKKGRHEEVKHVPASAEVVAQPEAKAVEPAAKETSSAGTGVPAASVPAPSQAQAPTMAPAKKYRVKTRRKVSLRGSSNTYMVGDILDPAGYGPDFEILKNALDLEEV